MMVIVLLIVAVILLNGYLASCFYNVACEKGFDDRKIFWICFFCSIAGYILVAALPDRKGRDCTG